MIRRPVIEGSGFEDGVPVRTIAEALPCAIGTRTAAGQARAP